MLKTFAIRYEFILAYFMMSLYSRYFSIRYFLFLVHKNVQLQCNFNMGRRKEIKKQGRIAQWLNVNRETEIFNNLILFHLKGCIYPNPWFPSCNSSFWAYNLFWTCVWQIMICSRIYYILKIFQLCQYSCIIKIHSLYLRTIPFWRQYTSVIFLVSSTEQ